MKSNDVPRPKTDPQHEHPITRHPGWDFLRRWFVVNSLLGGFFALCWLLLRSGAKPGRFAYPCQQAALSSATLAFGAPLVSGLIAARRRITAGLRSPVGVAIAALGLLLTTGVWGYLGRADPYRGPVRDPSADYRARVFHVSNCPQDPVGDRFIGLDNLLVLMGREGLKFYRSDVESLVSGPDGIIAAEDVVIIKINYQWDQRGGTNTDLLRGLIRRVVDHPNTFTGEIVICENAQFRSVEGFDRSWNNAQDIGLSPHDVVVYFQGLGYDISHYDWTALRFTQVDEYSDGDMTDGYIRYDYYPDLPGRVSYPKYQTDYGTYISLGYGVWDPDGGTYDREHLKFLNVPVLKSHHANYGATACVKDYMGVVTSELGTDSHNAIRYGILGALLGEIQLADLNILDCIWINANPYTGPYTGYGDALRRDELVASVDPIAADIWAVKNILIPGFYEEGFTPPWPYPSADPDDPDSDFREYLDNSMNYILAAGYDVTNDVDQIDALTWNGAGDADGDSDVDLADYAVFYDCFDGPGASPPPGCEIMDFNGNNEVAMEDFAGFQNTFTGPGTF